MSNNITKVLLGATVSLGAMVAPLARADDPAPAAEAEEKVDEALQAEIAYIEALVDNGYPDFAATVIEATKKKWPESEAMLFAIEVRGMLSLGKFDEAEAKIAALPDRNGAKYWAARLEVANNFHMRGKRSECEAIYSEFFKKFQTPPKGLGKLYRDACWAWGQLLAGSSRYEEATKIYEKLLSVLAATRKTNEDDDWQWCNVACETCEMYIHLATDTEKVQDRNKYLNPAKKLADLLLWERERYALFGRAVAMKANIELLKGDVARAQATIDDYYATLTEIHEALAKADPDGRQGWLKQSPMPICRYMLAQMLWKEAQAEYKKPKRDDEQVKALLFGKKLKNGKRNQKGAFNHAVNVFLTYAWSSWAPKAGEMSEEIRAFAEEKYGAKIKTNVTPEKLAEVRAMQFRGAHEKFAEGQYDEALADYAEALAGFPEGVESVRAIENTVMAKLNLLARGQGSDADKADWRIDADAIEGYLAERFTGVGEVVGGKVVDCFSGAADRTVMMEAGDAVQRLAATEKERGFKDRSDRLYKMFVNGFRFHNNAPLIALGKGSEAMKEEDYAQAASWLEAICTFYTNSSQYASALITVSTCYDKLGERAKAIDSLKKYCEVEPSVLKRTQAQMRLAMLHKDEGQELFMASATNDVPEVAEAQLRNSSKQIIYAIKQFNDFAKTCEAAMSDPSVTQADKAKYSELREGALFLVGDCWRKLTRPEDKLEAFRKYAVSAFESYVKLYPKGKYAKAAYGQLGTLYTALGDMEGSKSALDRLSTEFPDSDEAKNAMPRLAKALIEMGKTREGTDIYAGMLRTDGSYSASQFVNAGEALIDAGSWELADQAFEKAVAVAGTNQISTVARARIGQAKSLFRQKSHAEARAQLDLFLADPKMSRLAIAADANLLLAEIASDQGRTEKDDDLRRNHFNAAVGAIRKLRNYRRGKPQEEVDEVDLMSADIVIKRMRAEDALAETAASEEERQKIAAIAQDTCATAAQMLQTFLQTRAPDEAHPLSSMSAGALANLERCYSTMIPLFSRLGDEQADRVMDYGAQYLEYFPNGKGRTEVINCMNRAKNVVAAPSAAGAAPAPVQTVEENANVNEESEGDNENE